MLGGLKVSQLERETPTLTSKRGILLEGKEFGGEDVVGGSKRGYTGVELLHSATSSRYFQKLSGEDG